MRICRDPRFFRIPRLKPWARMKICDGDGTGLFYRDFFGKAHGIKPDGKLQRFLCRGWASWARLKVVVIEFLIALVELVLVGLAQEFDDLHFAKRLQRGQLFFDRFKVCCAMSETTILVCLPGFQVNTFPFRKWLSAGSKHHKQKKTKPPGHAHVFSG